MHNRPGLARAGLDARILVQHKPAGVAVLVTPWNFPAAMATRKIQAALANRLHGGAQTRLKHAADHAGLDADPGGGRRAGRRKSTSSRRSSGKVVARCCTIRACASSRFTGSTGQAQAAARAADNVVRPAMELGGNAPFIVFEDAKYRRRDRRRNGAKMPSMGGPAHPRTATCVHGRCMTNLAEAHRQDGGVQMGNGLGGRDARAAGECKRPKKRSASWSRMR